MVALCMYNYSLYVSCIVTIVFNRETRRFIATLLNYIFTRLFIILLILLDIVIVIVSVTLSFTSSGKLAIFADLTKYWQKLNGFFFKKILQRF